jgi:hypothetical protein
MQSHVFLTCIETTFFGTCYRFSLFTEFIIGYDVYIILVVALVSLSTESLVFATLLLLIVTD